MKMKLKKTMKRTKTIQLFLSMRIPLSKKKTTSKIKLKKGMQSRIKMKIIGILAKRQSVMTSKEKNRSASKTTRVKLFKRHLI